MMTGRNRWLWGIVMMSCKFVLSTSDTHIAVHIVVHGTQAFLFKCMSLFCNYCVVKGISDTIFLNCCLGTHNLSGIWRLIHSRDWLCTIKVSSSWCGSVHWVPVCEPKGCQFDSQSRHRPGLQARSPVGGGAGKRQARIDVSLSLFLPPFPLFQNKWIKS